MRALKVTVFHTPSTTNPDTNQETNSYWYKKTTTRALRCRIGWPFDSHGTSTVGRFEICDPTILMYTKVILYRCDYKTDRTRISMPRILASTVHCLRHQKYGQLAHSYFRNPSPSGSQFHLPFLRRRTFPTPPRCPGIFPLRGSFPISLET